MNKYEIFMSRWIGKEVETRCGRYIFVVLRWVIKRVEEDSFVRIYVEENSEKDVTLCFDMSLGWMEMVKGFL